MLLEEKRKKKKMDCKKTRYGVFSPVTFFSTMQRMNRYLSPGKENLLHPKMV